MVLKYVTKNGVRYHEPPYTKEQEAEFYRCVGWGPITVARPAKATERDNDGSGTDHRRTGVSQEETGSR
jgi:hypothetical protein